MVQYGAYNEILVFELTLICLHCQNMKVVVHCSHKYSRIILVTSTYEYNQWCKFTCNCKYSICCSHKYSQFILATATYEYNQWCQFTCDCKYSICCSHKYRIVCLYLRLQLTNTINGANLLATANIPFVAVASIVGLYLQLQLMNTINCTNKRILLTLNT